MKKLFTLLLTALLCLCPLYVFATDAPLANAPYLESISFRYAKIDGGFKQDKTVFDLTLEDSSASPVLENYSINGEAKIFVTYNYDNLNRQTGVVVTLAFENGSVIYTFNYKNIPEPKISGNANLAALSCEYGEVQPQINANDTVYKLYIPSDLTQLNITPVTEDTNAYCANQQIEINEEQEPTLSFTVSASDGTTKNYKFKVKHINKSIEQVKAEMEQDDFVSFVDGELFYQKPIFLIIFGASIGGIIVLLIMAAATKRITVNPYDTEEKEFYSPIE